MSEYTTDELFALQRWEGMTMRERIADELRRYETSLASSTAPEANRNYQPYWLNAASVVLNAMREPTIAMQDAADHSSQPYRAMIDEAMK